MGDKKAGRKLEKKLLAGHFGAADFRRALSETLPNPSLTVSDFNLALDQSELLRNGSLQRVNLAGVQWAGRDLSGAKLAAVNLTLADLSGADLSEVDLTGANLTGADLSRANLSRARLFGALLHQANLEGATLVDADFSGAEIVVSCFGGAKASGLKAGSSRWIGSRITDGDFSGADFTKARLIGMDLRRADLTGVKFSREAFFQTARTIRSRLFGFGDFIFRKIIWGLLIRPGVAFVAKIVRVLLFVWRVLSHFPGMFWRHRRTTIPAILFFAIFNWVFLLDIIFWRGTSETYRSGFISMAEESLGQELSLDGLLCEKVDPVGEKVEQKPSRPIISVNNYLNQKLNNLGPQWKFYLLNNAYIFTSIFQMHLEYADILAALGKTRAAENEIWSLTQQYSDHPLLSEAWLRLVELAKTDGDFSLARELLAEQTRTPINQGETIGWESFAGAKYLYRHGCFANADTYYVRLEKQITGPRLLAQISLERLRVELNKSLALSEDGLAIFSEIKQRFPENQEVSTEAEILVQCQMLNGVEENSEAFDKLQLLFQQHLQDALGISAGLCLANYLESWFRYAEASARLEELLSADHDHGLRWLDLTARLVELDLLQKKPDQAIARIDARMANRPPGIYFKNLLLLRARALIAAERPVEAMELYDRLLQDFAAAPSPFAEVLMAKARLLQALDRTAEAMRIYRRVTDFSKDQAIVFEAVKQIALDLRAREGLYEERHYFNQWVNNWGIDSSLRLAVKFWLADNLLKQNNSGQALQLIDEIAASGTRFWLAQALEKKKEYYLSKGDLTRVAQINAELLKRIPYNPDQGFSNRLQLADLQYRHGNIENAIRIYESIADSGGPEIRLEGLQALLKIYFQLNREKKVREVQERIQSEYADDPNVLASTGLAVAEYFLQAGKATEAAELFLALSRQSVDQSASLRALLGLAKSYFSLARFSEAISIYQQVLADSPGDGSAVAFQARQGLGLIAEQQRDYPQAIREYEQALSLAEQAEPRLSILTAIIRVTAENGQADRARGILADLKKKYPDHPAEVDAAELALLSILARQGRSDEAIAGYEKIVSSSDNELNLAEANRSLISLLMNRNRQVDAEEVFTRWRNAISGDPGQVFAADFYWAEILRQHADYATAETLLRRIADQKEYPAERAQALLALAEIAAAGKRPDNAIRLYQLTAEEFVDFPAVQGAAFQGLASLMIMTGHPDEAIADYRRILQLPFGEKEKVDAYLSMIRLYRQQGDEATAETLMREMEQSFPDSVLARWNASLDQAAELTGVGRFDEALEIYRNLANEVPDPDLKGQARLGLGTVFKAQGKTEEARQTFRELTVDSQISPIVRRDGYQQLADLFRRSGNWDDAAAVLTEGIAQFGDAALKHSLEATLAAVRLESQNPAEAEKIFRMWEQSIDPRFRFDAWLGLGRMAMEKQDYEAARQYYRQAIETPVESDLRWPALEKTAQSFLAERRFAEAQKTFESMTDQYGHLPVARWQAEKGIAEIDRAQGRIAEAMTVYRRALTETADVNVRRSARTEMARLYLQQGDVEHAKAIFLEMANETKAAKSGPVEMGLAELMVQSGDPDAAAKVYREVLRRSPGSADGAMAATELVRLYGEGGDYPRAKKEMTDLISEVKGSAAIAYPIHLGLADWAERIGRRDEAAGEFEAALGFASDVEQKAQALLGLGRAQQKAGRLTEAQATFRRVLAENKIAPPTRARTLLDLANLSVALQQPQTAGDYFKQASDAASGQPIAGEVLADWANWSLTADRMAEFEALVDRAVRHSPADPSLPIRLRLNAAEHFVQRLDWDGADRQLALLIQAYGETPAMAPVYLRRAQLDLQAGRLAKAREDFLFVGATFAADRVAAIEAELGLAKVTRAAGQTAAAITQFQSIIERYPNDRITVRAMQLLADLYGESGNVDGQKAILRRLIAEQTEDPSVVRNARLTLADLYFSQEDFTPALREYLSIVQEYPQSEEALFAKANAARLYVRLGDKKRAVDLLQEIIAGGPPEHEVVKGAKQLLAEIYRRE
ncbi:MAG: tetratricopeptide repeat protein [Myxococcales bacterium]|nr:tetratricopeptide repeat protein [Myxococcales bacterium]